MVSRFRSHARATVGWREIRRSSKWLPRISLGELWSYRELVLALAVRDLKLRYKQTVLGVMWALIQPLAAAGIFAVFLGRLAHIPSEGVPYPLFVYVGLVIWTYVSTSVLAAADSLVENHRVVRTVYFPRLLAPIAAVLPGMVDLAVSLVAAGAFLVAYEVTPSTALLTLPVWCAAAVLLACSVGTWLSALNVLYRDVRYAFGFVLQIWLFASPVVFPSSLVTGTWRHLYSLNPMVGLVDGMRWAVLGTSSLTRDDVLSLVSATIIFATGLVYFTHVERQFADRI